MNVANQITEMALKFPYKRAVVHAKSRDRFGRYLYNHYTFIELEKRINKLANALKTLGVKRGDKVLLFVKPSLDFSAYTFALFKMGATPILIDPGMGVKNFLKAVEEVRADVLIGIPRVHILRRLFKKSFTAIRLFLSTDPFALLTPSIEKVAKFSSFDFTAEVMQKEDMAAILFTSGGTGKPKGVIYSHDIFIAQTKLLQNEYQLTDQDVDIPGFPLFALFTLAMGMTSCIPDMDPSHPGKSDPKKLIQNIFDQGATFVAGSPAIWQKVADYCLKNKLTLPTVKYCVMFGAPISVKLHEKFAKILPNGTTYTPYGATECLPVSNMSGTEVLKETKELTLVGMGTCVGLPFQSVKIEITPITNKVLKHISETQFLPAKAVGEIIVNSSVVTPGYYELPQKTAEAKILSQEGLWHRMGDVGYKDELGRLWFLGRKAHVVATPTLNHYPIGIEAIFNRHPEVARSALVTIKSNPPRPGIVIERVDKKTKLSKVKQEDFFAELIDLAQNYDHTKMIHDIYLYKNFPVDVRHNIKIDRAFLTDWVNSQTEQA
jgi:olefin beta-lactone synthetase